MPDLLVHAPTWLLRSTDLLRPVGRSRWGMAAWLALGLGAILGASALLGRAEVGASMALGFVLTAVPSLPVSWRPALVTLAIRTATVLGGAAVAVLVSGSPAVLFLAIVIAAVCGAVLPVVGPTAGLTVVLVSVDVGSGESPSATVLLPYAVGALVVIGAWAAWYCCAERTRIAGARPHSASVASPSRSRRDMGPHAVRVGVAVAAAVGLARLLPADLVGGHWLVTSVLLTVQPAATDTGIRLAQRISGNAIGALIAAVMLGAHPSIPAVAVVTVVLFTVAMALRPVNYTWWAITGPPVLLVVSEYPRLFPWYEGGVRLVMNLAGAAIVLVVVFAVPWAMRRAPTGWADVFPGSIRSDSAREIQSKGMQ